ncbi:MAG: hypothetical protein MPJ78_14855 [Hyphomicrobiaceae bacterium]|nr:hypothetical protein [Hyphomicrobiaceae bacterium]
MRMLIPIAMLLGLALSAYGGWVLYATNAEQPAYRALTAMHDAAPT